MCRAQPDSFVMAKGAGRTRVWVWNQEGSLLLTPEPGAAQSWPSCPLHRPSSWNTPCLQATAVSSKGSMRSKEQVLRGAGAG